MTGSFLTNVWIIAFAFLVILPFNIYDLYKKFDKTWKNYVEPAVTVIIAVATLGGMIFDLVYCWESNTLTMDNILKITAMMPLINHKVIWLLIGIVYIDGIYELIKNRYTKRDISFVCLSTVAILIYVILYNI